MDDIVCACVVLHGNQEAISLRRCEVDHLRVSRLGINAISLNNAHGMVFKPKILRREGSHVDYTEHVGLSRLDLDLEVLGIVHECRFRNGLSSCGVCVADETLEKCRW